MPRVIDAEYLLEKKLKLPTEAFFVDTNTIVYTIDPFGQSQEDGLVSQLNPKLQQLLNYLKNTSKCYCTIEAAFEYYNHIRYGTLKNYKSLNKGILYSDFKKLRKTDSVFRNDWHLRIRKFKRVFEKNFVLFDVPLQTDHIFSAYNHDNDFIDHLLWQSLLSLPVSKRCILTHDEDFYEFEGDFILLTFNEKIIDRAKKDGSMFSF